MLDDILQFRVLGNPISHSLSPFIHQYFADVCGIKINYEKILLDTSTDIFENYIKDFFSASNSNNIGLNITLPFKERAFKLAKHASKSAFYAKASNTLYIKSGEIFADNTDGLGLIADIKDYYHINLTGKSILLIGAGGASRGVLYNLSQEFPKYILIANRTVAKAKELAQEVKEYSQNVLISFCSIEDLQMYNFHLANKFDVIINASSMGMDDKNHNFYINNHHFHEQTFAYDMIYNKPSPFLEWAKKSNLNYAEGIGMLIRQAAYAFKIWNSLDETPPVQELYSSILSWKA